MIEVIHNNRCSKSRQALQFLDEKGVVYQVRYYLENPLTKSEIEDVLKKLDLKPMDIIRKDEALWKEEFVGKEYSDTQLIDILAQNPKLLQRPIITNDDKAVIGRPTENIEKLLS